MKRSVLVVVAAVFTWGILSWPCRAQLLGTAFTYQGELRAGGVPATGLHDLRFRLYDAATGGTQVGPQVCLDNVSVADGRFTVSLDFGAQFAGLQRFLEIEVRTDTGQNCTNPTGFTTLSPRQPLTGAPHALFALNAGQLNGQPSSFYLNAANLTSGTLADARLSSNVPRLNSAQTFVGVQTFSAAPSFTAAGAPFTVSSSTLVANLNADLLDGLDSTAFLRSGVSGAGGDLAGTYPNPTVAGLQTRPVSASAPTSGQVLKWDGSAWAPAADDGLTLPFSGSANATGSTAFFVINTATSGTSGGILGRSESTSGRGVYGVATATSGETYGVWGLSASTDGMGVVGWATATSGSNIGVWGRSSSTSGTGVYGEASATSGFTVGVTGRSVSVSGTGVYGLALAANGLSNGVHGESLSEYGTGVLGEATATSGSNIGVWGRSAGTSGMGVYGLANATSGTTYGVWGQSNSTDGRGVFGEATANSGFTYGVYGRSASTSGRGVFGLAAATTGGAYGVYGRSDSTGGRGVFGWATATSGINYGVYGVTYSPSGYAGYFVGRGYFSENVGLGTTAPAARLDILGGTWDTAGTEGDLRIGSADHRLKFGIATGGGGAGHATIAAQGGVNLLSLGAGSTLDTQRTLTVTGEGRVGIGTTAPSFKLHAVESGSPGRAVYGQATATSGTTYGGWFESTSTAGTGVRGRATAGSGTTYGVLGQSASTSGTGVFGWATATSGGGWGVYGSTSSSGSNAYGVFGVEPSGGAGHAVYASGTLAATGTKSFQIDHPLTPETHYLNHFCTEAPEPLNAYSGNVITDELGYAVVQLPDYFESINRDFRYQLTVVDDGEQHFFVLAKVVRKIKDNQFTIRTSAPNVEVSWRVEAVRHDRYVQQYGFRTVQEKENEIKGKYLQPELYGKPREQGIHYRPDLERPAPAAPPREQADLAVTPPAPGRP